MYQLIKDKAPKALVARNFIAINKIALWKNKHWLQKR